MVEFLLEEEEQWRAEEELVCDPLVWHWAWLAWSSDRGVSRA